ILRLFSHDAPETSIAQIRSICKKHKGNCTTFVTVEGAPELGIRRYRLPAEWSVEPTDALIGDLDKAFGNNRVLFSR
ncbi:MAG: hypothetical protein ABI444_01335, partial [Candidatus Kapaibacterium sp.]